MVDVISLDWEGPPKGRTAAAVNCLAQSFLSSHFNNSLTSQSGAGRLFGRDLLLHTFVCVCVCVCVFQVQLLVSEQDVENYKQIKTDLDQLRLTVEKSELWVEKSGAYNGEDLGVRQGKEQNIEVLYHRSVASPPFEKQNFTLEILV